MKARTQATGHLDRNGRMIHRHDTLRIYRHRSGDQPGVPPHIAHVIWVGSSWLLYFGSGQAERLNNYTSRELEKVTKNGTKSL